MDIKKVETAKDKKEFLKVSRLIYRKDPYWISHLDQDVEAVFNPAKNNLFQNGEAIRWIMKDTNGNLIGRVAAFINKQVAYTHTPSTGGMGFFECINDKDAAFALFDKCREWLLNRGIEAMEGPVNFGEKDRYWGLLVHNAGYRPPYLMNYNPAYYKELFEAYGFKNFYEQYIYRVHEKQSYPDIFEKILQRLTQTQGYSFQTMNKKFLDKYALDFMTIYNLAWKDSHKHFRPLTKQDVLKIFKTMQKIIDPDIIIFVYHNNKPVAFSINIPELNGIFRYMNGKLNFTNKLKFFYYKKLGRCSTIYGLVFGTIPEYRNKGIESAMATKLRKILQVNKNYNDIYIAWIGDFNPIMLKLAKLMNCHKIFTLITYKKLFNPKAEFTRHPVVNHMTV